VSLGITKKHPQLMSIILKMAESVRTEDIAIAVSSHFQPLSVAKVDHSEVWQMLGISLVVFIAFSLWVRHLNRVNNKISAANTEMEKAKESSERMSAQMSALLDSTGQGILTINVQGKIGKAYSQYCLSIFNCKDDIGGKNPMQFPAPPS